jgi:hypothetical protein
LTKFLYDAQIETHTHTHMRPLGLSERVIGLLQRILPTQHTTNARDEHPYTQRNSNPRSQHGIQAASNLEDTVTEVGNLTL